MASSANASLTAATTSDGPRSPPIASTAIRAWSVVGLAVSGLMAGRLNPGDGLDLDVEDLAAAIGPRLGVHAVRAELAAIGVLGKLGGPEGVGGATVGAAA